MADVDFVKLQGETMEALNVLRKSHEQHGEQSAEYKQIQENTDKKMAEFEEANQKLVAEAAADRKKAEQMEEKMTAFEKEIMSFGSNPGQKKGNYKESPEYKAFGEFALNGDHKISAEQKALLRTDDSVAGGYLTMPEMSMEILKNITEISPIRQHSRVKSIGSRSMVIPIRSTIPTARFEGEGEEDQDSVSSYNSETLTTFALTTTVPFTREQMMSKMFDIESEIMQDVSEAYALAEGRNMVLSGDGSQKPQAILQDTRLTGAGQFRETESAGLLDFDSMRLLTGDIKVGYMPMYFFNRRTKANLLVQKGSDGQYLWSMAADGAPAMLSGYNYALFEDMPDIATGAFAVGFGDLMKGYCITDFMGMEMIRDEVTQKNKRIIELTFHKWLTGQVVLPEAIRLLKIK